MAAQAVFDTTELLENILLNLDVKSILRAKATDKTFAATVNGSIHLRRRCWFTPQVHDPKARRRGYNWNLLIDRRSAKLGLASMLEWPATNNVYFMNLYNWQPHLLFGRTISIVDLYFRSWDDVVEGIGSKGRSCNDMLVMQPTQPMNIIWSVGFYQARVPGRSIWEASRLKQWLFQTDNGYLPTLRDLKLAVIERFGVLGRRFDVVDEEDGRSKEGELNLW